MNVQALSWWQAATIVVRHLIPVASLLFFGQSAGQFLLLSMFNIALSLASIGTIGAAVSARQRAGASRDQAGALGTWLVWIAAGVLVTLILTVALSWWILRAALGEGRPLFDGSLARAVLSMVAAAVPGLLYQYRSDLTRASKERKERGQSNAIALSVIGILIYLLWSWDLILTMIAATALFIARDLRPDLLQAAIRGNLSSCRLNVGSMSRRSARLVVAFAAFLPLALLLPPLLGNPMGPVIRLGAGSPYHLEGWAVFCMLAELLLVVPGSVLAYRLRGWMGAAGLLTWMLLLFTFSCAFRYIE